MKLRIKTSVLKAVLVVLLVMILLIGIVLLLHNIEQRHYSFNPDDDYGNDYDGDIESVFYDGKWYQKRKKVETILFLGLDKYNDRENKFEFAGVNDKQCDFIIALIVDHENKCYTALHINRDVMTEIYLAGPNGDISQSFVAQLCLAHPYGGADEKQACKNTVKAVSNFLLGTEIKDYIAMTFDAMSIINDAVGGVEVEVMDDGIFTDAAKGDKKLLLGEDALKYFRARITLEDDTNLHRMDRQRQYLIALKERFDKAYAKDPSVFADILFSVGDSMTSNCTGNELSKHFSDIYDYKFNGFDYIEGENVQGELYMEFYADQDALQSQIIGYYYVESPEQ